MIGSHVRGLAGQRAPDEGAPTLALVVPTLNARASLAATIASVRAEATPARIIVSDGGSTDGTGALASSLGADLVEGAPGRGQQLRDGGLAGLRSGAGWLLFLHADTRLGPGWAAAAADLMNGTAERAGAFRLRLDAAEPAARRIERLANWRARRFGLPYGDQGLLISARHYERLGGFRAMPLMEDVDLARRIRRRDGRSALVMLPADALTSAVRYRLDGYWRRPIRNLMLLALYHLGVAPATLARLYR